MVVLIPRTVSKFVFSFVVILSCYDFYFPSNRLSTYQSLPFPDHFLLVIDGFAHININLFVLLWPFHLSISSYYMTLYTFVFTFLAHLSVSDISDSVIPTPILQVHLTNCVYRKCLTAYHGWILCLFIFFSFSHRAWNYVPVRGMISTVNDPIHYGSTNFG